MQAKALFIFCCVFAVGRVLLFSSFQNLLIIRIVFHIKLDWIDSHVNYDFNTFCAYKDSWLFHNLFQKEIRVKFFSGWLFMAIFLLVIFVVSRVFSRTDYARLLLFCFVSLKFLMLGSRRLFKHILCSQYLDNNLHKDTVDFFWTSHRWLQKNFSACPRG